MKKMFEELTDEEFDEKVKELYKGLDILKQTGPRKMIMPDGSAEIITYENTKKGIDEMVAVVAASRAIKDLS